MNRRSVIAALLASVALSAGIGKATAQDGYPSRVIKFIVPFAAGSATDTLARVLGQKYVGKPRAVRGGRQHARCQRLSRGPERGSRGA